MEWYLLVTVFAAVTTAFMLSASAGFGGSLILVPTLALVLGTKSGVALAALLLAANNVVKVFAYRRTLPYRKAAPVIALVAAGAFLGARLLVSASERVVTIRHGASDRVGWPHALAAVEGDLRAQAIESATFELIA
ncbi:TSUP family transporter [Streptomyces sp. NPDC059875]|uniref:TSUP family transporter n=1 Tax=unclassified Streptomyces TaxID=2593676 RepID=UPI0036679629